MACSRLALPRWSRLAREAEAMSLDALAMQALAPSLSPRSLDAPRLTLALTLSLTLALTLALTPSLAMQVHAALHARDNTSDVWRGLDQLAEQAPSLAITLPRGVAAPAPSARYLVITPMLRHQHVT